MMWGMLLPVLLAPLPAGEKDFFHIPGADDFRMQVIERVNDRDWPFSVDTGYLMCIYILGQRTVYFSEILDEDEKDEGEPRTVVVSVDPLDLAFVNIGASSLFAPHSGLAELIPRVAPYVRLGQRLCEQPRGSVIRRGEL